jgi:tetratricopeptide (TPR) repeat protein
MFVSRVCISPLQEREAERLAKEARSIDFNRGKYLYERGQYQEAVAALTKALDAEGPFSQLGGEVQLWLALSYQVHIR